MSVVERFDVLARRVDMAGRGLTKAEVVEAASACTGVCPTRLQSLEFLGEELGFLERGDNLLRSNLARTEFANYMTVHRGKAKERPSAGTHDFQVCATLPPAWQAPFRAALGDLVQETEAGERQVVEAAKQRLLVVTAYLDPAVLQLKLQVIHRPDISVAVLTFEFRLVQKFPDGNWRLRRIFEIIGGRFGDVSVHHFARNGMIVHAKLWVSEGSFLLTSANVSGNSAADNMEVGIYSTNPALSSTLAMIVDTAVALEGVERLAP